MGRRERRDEARRQRWGQIFIGLFLVALMVLSILGFGMNRNSSSSKFSFNNVDFVIGKDVFSFATPDGVEHVVRSLPVAENGSSITFNVYGNYVNLEVSPTVKPLWRGAQVHLVTFDPDMSHPEIQVVDQGRFDLSQQVPNVFSGVTAKSTEYPVLPVVTCANATTEATVLLYVLDNQTAGARITTNGSCIIASGSPMALLATTDYFILAYHGVFDSGDA